MIPSMPERPPSKKKPLLSDQEMKSIKRWGPVIVKTSD